MLKSLQSPKMQIISGNKTLEDGSQVYGYIKLVKNKTLLSQILPSYFEAMSNIFDGLTEKEILEFIRLTKSDLTIS